MHNIDFQYTHSMFFSAESLFHINFRSQKPRETFKRGSYIYLSIYSIYTGENQLQNKA